MKYDIGSFKKAIANPRNILHEVGLSDKIDSITTPIMKESFETRYGGGADVMAEDWDNLIIIDACRYDVFEKYNSIEGDLTKIVSKGSNSDEFIENNFVGRSFYDTIYITANAKSHQNLHNSDVFNNIEYTFDESIDISGTNENWLQKIKPEVVRDAAVSEFKKKPNKRFIIHFMQPHPPFLGERAAHLREYIRQSYNIKFAQWDEADAKLPQADVIRNLTTAASHGYISSADLYNVYVENLSLVLKEVDKLISELGGKSVITSDHGELLGISNNILLTQKFSHPRETYVEELRIVPWLEPKFENRREITSDAPEEPQQINDGTIQKQLEALGYV